MDIFFFGYIFPTSELTPVSIMFAPLFGWLSPPASPNRHNNTNLSVEEQDTPPRDQDSPPGQNWVKLPNEDTYTQFVQIVSCGCNEIGQMTFQLQWQQDDMHNMLNSPPVFASLLVHNDEAVRWADRFYLFCHLYGSATPITGPYTYEDIDTSATLEPELVTWLEKCHLSAFGPLLQEHWHTSLSMLRLVDEETLASWGMKPTPTHWMMKCIRE